MLNFLYKPVDNMSSSTLSLDRFFRFRPRGHRCSSRSSQQWRNNEPQRIPGGYIVPRRLEAALKEKWPNQYVVEVSLNYIL
jgi:hypothetical protein